jgi:hypothetical protein
MGYSEQVYEFSDLIANREFLQQLSECWLLKMTLLHGLRYSANWVVSKTFEADTT